MDRTQLSESDKSFVFGTGLFLHEPNVLIQISIVCYINFVIFHLVFPPIDLYARLYYFTFRLQVAYTFI